MKMPTGEMAHMFFCVPMDPRCVVLCTCTLSKTHTRTHAHNPHLTVHSIPKIRIHSRQAKSLLADRLLVQIDSWEADSKHPNGHYVKRIGAWCGVYVHAV